MKIIKESFKEEDMVSDLEVGDQVVSDEGDHGVIVDIEGDRVGVRLDKGNPVAPSYYHKSELFLEDTVKTKSGKWVNKGKEGTHGEFDTKKQADAQRRAMYANGFKEEISDEDMKHQKENEDTINLMEEILVSIDNAIYTLKNRVYYGGSFEPNITNLEQSCNKMIKFSKELKEY